MFWSSSWHGNARRCKFMCLWTIGVSLCVYLSLNWEWVCYSITRNWSIYWWCVAEQLRGKTLNNRSFSLFPYKTRSTIQCESPLDLNDQTIFKSHIANYHSFLIWHARNHNHLTMIMVDLHRARICTGQISSFWIESMTNARLMMIWKWRGL